MALMAKMRSLAPVFIIGVGVLFVAFMVLTDSNVLEAVGGTSNEVGSINGEDITYQQFQQFMDQARQQQEQQSGQPIEEENLEQFRDQVWNSLVQQILIEQQLEEYGVFVSDDEIREVILGENPPDFLKQNFIDSLGNFNRQAYEAAIFDPRNEQALVQAEDVIRQQLLSQKLQSILFASVTVSEGEIKRRFIDNNIFMTAEYVLADLATIPDSVVQYSDEEINAYYEEHKEDYKHPEQRKIKYVLFSVEPSADDSAAILNNMLNVREYALTDTADFKTVIDIYSDAPYSRDTIAANKVPESIKDSIADGKIGDIIGPVINQGSWELYKVVEVITGGDEYVKASHILISSAEGEAEALEEANRIYNELKQGADFAALAKEYSEDPGSAANGGDLGWFGKGRMVPEFEQAAFSGNVGEIQAPVKTSYGYHIIKVTGKSNKNYVVEKVVNAIEPSGITYDDIVTQAGDFAYLAEKNGFDEEVQQYGYTAYESNPFTQDVYAVPGIGYNKAVVNFAFDNSVGDISPVFKIPAGYVVCQITDVIESGYKPIEQVKPQIILQVREEEKYEQLLTILHNAREQFGDDLNKAPQVDNHLKYNVASNFTTAGNIPTIGVDYKFSAAAHDLQINQMSEPVKGQRGYYLIRLKNKTPFDTTAYSMQWNSLRDNLLQEKRNYLYNQWLTNLKENSEIEDKRYIFYSR